MKTFVKRLANNELGMTGGHQKGGILVPKDCTGFFPILGRRGNPEISIRVLFLALESTVKIRFIYYRRGTRDEYRLSPVPARVLSGVKAGDYFLMWRLRGRQYVAIVAKTGGKLHRLLLKKVGSRAGVVLPKDSSIERIAPQLAEGGKEVSQGPFERLARSQGISASPLLRKAIEVHAMSAATRYFKKQGYMITDMSENHPYDLLCRHPEGDLFVEVKGTQSSGEEVLLTKNEVSFAKKHAKKMVLFIRHSVKIRNPAGANPTASGGDNAILRPWRIHETDLIPTVFRYSVPGKMR